MTPNGARKLTTGLIRGEVHINGSGHLAAAGVKSGLALLFPASARATAAELEPLLARPSQAAVARVSNQRGRGQSCLELLSNGLTFDVTSLAPEIATPVAAPRRDRLSFRAVNRKEAPDHNPGLKRHHTVALPPARSGTPQCAQPARSVGPGH